MAYLEVKVDNMGSGACVVSANGVSLGRDKGFWGAIFGTYYPSVPDYFNGLDYEGWRLVSSNTSGSIAIVDGLPFGFSGGTYIFQGSGRYEIEWNQERRWQFTGPRLY